MKTLQLDDITARQEYPTATPVMKAILEKSFGKDFFSQDTEDFITSIEAAEAFTGEKLIINLTDTPDEIAYKQAKIIIKALNNDPTFPDFLNTNQRKYSVYAKRELSGVGLSYYGFADTRLFASVGSRLVLKNPDHCKYLINQFPAIMKAFLF